MESFGLPGRERSEFIDQLATGVIGGRDGEIMAEKGTCKERLLQIISVTSQVAISHGIHRYKHVLRYRQATRGRMLPVAWGWHIDAAQGIIKFDGKKAVKD